MTVIDTHHRFLAKWFLWVCHGFVHVPRTVELDRPDE
jgi:hypothetical protein